MKRLVVFGTGQIAELAEYYFRTDSDYEIAAFTADGAFIREGMFCKHPVVAFEDIARSFPPSEHACFVAVSYNKLNALRAGKVTEARGKGYALASYVSSRLTAYEGFAPGDNAFLLEDNTIQPFARIGSNVTLWSGNHIGHHAVIEDDCFLASHIVVSGNVRIGKGSFVGVNATIRDGVTIGARSIVGAGALILEDAPDESVFSPGGTERSRVPSSRVRNI